LRTFLGLNACTEWWQGIGGS